jgi:uncharacterized protein YaaW (UPF0174 family)
VESESASTIAIAKENLTRLANYRRIAVEENVQTNDNSVAAFLSLVRNIFQSWSDAMFSITLSYFTTNR